MAQSLITLPSETVFVECRAFVFYYDIQLNRWSEVGDPNVYSRIQLLCSRPPGSTGLYRIFGRLETTGMVRCVANRVINSSCVTQCLLHSTRKTKEYLWIKFSLQLVYTPLPVVLLHTLLSLLLRCRQRANSRFFLSILQLSLLQSSQSCI